MFTPDPARHARYAAHAIGATYEDIDGGQGYLFRITKAGRSVVIGAGGVCSFPINSATAFTLSRDKAHTKSALASLGIPVIPGRLFFAHARRAGLRNPGREIADALAFAQTLGFPVFCKPNLGARGNFAEIVADTDGLADYAARVALEFEAFLVEPVIRGTEHRVLVHDGRPVFHSIKTSPSLGGDGVSTAAALLDALNIRLAREGLSLYPPSVLAISGYSPSSIPEKGAALSLLGRRNLSTYGSAEFVSLKTPPLLETLALNAVAAVGLRLGAVDVFDVSERRDFSDLLVIEVNGNPGLRTLEAAGHREVINAIWMSMLEDMLGV